jgi:hypothetical protein
MNKRMTMADMVKVSAWVAAKKYELLKHSQQELCRMVEAETGVKTHPVRMADFEKAVGVERHRGNVGGTRTDRAVVLARELIRVQKELGMSISLELFDIAERK